jgi:hypothetical protein
LASNENGGNWGTSRIAGRSRPDGGSYEVPAWGLDALLDQLGMDAVDLIKVDIEGAESLALAGMAEGMRCGRYRRILLELHPPVLAEHGSSAAAIVEEMLELGYRGWVIAHDAADVRRAAYSNWHSAESFLRPLRWPESLDSWPHLIFVLGDHSLYSERTDFGERDQQ